MRKIFALDGLVDSSSVLSFSEFYRLMSVFQINLKGINFYMYEANERSYKFKELPIKKWIVSSFSIVKTKGKRVGHEQ